ncbi:MAG: HAD family hydrolase [Actinobacteria bacterium]|nr:HAD family hydrolase [Actinomycetota bacterium]
MRIPIFDLDGTLIDSDAALLDAFVMLGVPRELITFGHVLEDECARLNLSVDEYLDAYDDSAAQPYPGVDDLVMRLDRWAVCSNKDRRTAAAELARLRWEPDVALFADAFDGGKELGPVLAALALDPADAVFVGDTDHDRQCASSAGTMFALAAWNPRALAIAQPGELVVAEPLGLLDLL